MKKCLPYRKKQCFVKVAMLQKMTDKLKKHNNFFVNFSSKIDAKSSQKSRKTREATKVDKNTTLESPFSLDGAILGHFWVPAGRQKSLPWRLGGAKKA